MMACWAIQNKIPDYLNLNAPCLKKQGSHVMPNTCPIYNEMTQTYFHWFVATDRFIIFTRLFSTCCPSIWFQNHVWRTVKCLTMHALTMVYLDMILQKLLLNAPNTGAVSCNCGVKED